MADGSSGDFSYAKERMRIQSNGNVGIGTDSPQAQLHIEHTDATTNATTNTGSEIFLVTGDGTNSAIWMWDDLSEGYGVSTNELTFVAKLENFNNDNLTGSEIVFGAI